MWAGMSCPQTGRSPCTTGPQGRAPMSEWLVCLRTGLQHAHAQQEHGYWLHLQSVGGGAGAITSLLPVTVSHAAIHHG
jgi:hypothetical protein